MYSLSDELDVKQCIASTIVPLTVAQSCSFPQYAGQEELLSPCEILVKGCLCWTNSTASSMVEPFTLIRYAATTVGDLDKTTVCIYRSAKFTL